MSFSRRIGLAGQCPATDSDRLRLDWLYEKFTGKTLATLDPATAATQADTAPAASKKL